MADEAKKDEVQKTPEEIAAEKKAVIEKQIQDIKDNKEIAEEDKPTLIAAFEQEITPVATTETPTPDNLTAPALSFEDEQLLNTIKGITSDPLKANYLAAIADGNIEDLLLTFVPKGEDYSKLSEKAIYQRSLELQGFEGDDLEKQMGLFADFSSTAKDKKVKEAKKFLDENGRGNIPTELSKKVEEIANNKKRRELATQQYNQETIQQIENKVGTLVGKPFDGYTVQKEDKKELTDLIAYCTVADKNGKYNVDKAIDIATKAFAYPKVLKAKDIELASTKEELSKARAILRKLANVSVGSPTNKSASGGNGAPVQKTKQIQALNGKMITVPDYSTK